MLDGGTGGRRTAALHLALVVALSVGFESLFIRHGLNALDEGWPLYAAMELHAGGRLYDDVFFVFPPGHVLPAWIAYALAPPGVVLARMFYAGFAVALCAALYAVGRRITTPGFALLGAAMAAIAAPNSHNSHLLFGYRYLVWSALAIWCFSERLRTGRTRWLVAAGAFTGLALVFRFDAAGAVALGIAAGTLAAQPGWRALRRDAGGYTLGLAAVALPVVTFFAASVGLETLWREVVVRPLDMTRLQSLPLPPLEAPARWGLWQFRLLFVAFQFRLWAVLYGIYALVLAVQLVRALAAGRRFERPLLLAFVVWGGVFYLRSLGRSDEPHLDSAVPPAFVLLAHAVGVAASRWRSPVVRAAIGAGAFAAWVGLTAVPRYLSPSRRGSLPVQTLDGATAIHPRHYWRDFDELVGVIQSETQPDDVILDLSTSPLLLVVAKRSGPGRADLVMPGTFLTEAEELALIERLERSPPALVIVSQTPFDRTLERGLKVSAPRVLEWVGRRYAKRAEIGRFVLLAPAIAGSGSSGEGTANGPSAPDRP